MDERMSQLRGEIAAATTMSELARIEEKVDREFRPSPHTEGTNITRGAVWRVLIRSLSERADALAKGER